MLGFIDRNRGYWLCKVILPFQLIKHFYLSLSLSLSLSLFFFAQIPIETFQKIDCGWRRDVRILQCLEIILFEEQLYMLPWKRVCFKGLDASSTREWTWSDGITRPASRGCMHRLQLARRMNLSSSEREQRSPQRSKLQNPGSVQAEVEGTSVR